MKEVVWRFIAFGILYAAGRCTRNMKGIPSAKSLQDYLLHVSLSADHMRNVG